MVVLSFHHDEPSSHPFLFSFAPLVRRSVIRGLFLEKWFFLHSILPASNRKLMSRPRAVPRAAAPASDRSRPSAAPEWGCDARHAPFFRKRWPMNALLIYPEFPDTFWSFLDG